MSLITIFSYNLVVPATTDLFITASARQGYSNGARSWQMEIWFGGNLAKITGGGSGITDNPNMICGLTAVPPGTYLVELKWSADNPVNLIAPSMVIQGSYK